MKSIRDPQPSAKRTHYVGGAGGHSGRINEAQQRSDNIAYRIEAAAANSLDTASRLVEIEGRKVLPQPDVNRPEIRLSKGISSGATHFERLHDLHGAETRVIYAREVRRTSKVSTYVKSPIDILVA